MFRQRICSISSKLNTHQQQQQLGSQLLRCQMNIQKKFGLLSEDATHVSKRKRKWLTCLGKRFTGLLELGVVGRVVRSSMWNGRVQILSRRQVSINR